MRGAVETEEEKDQKIKTNNRIKNKYDRERQDLRPCPQYCQR